MSIVAEFAHGLHETDATRFSPPQTSPLYYEGTQQHLHDVRAVIFDIYGTLINHWKPVFGDAQTKQQHILQGFEKVIERFGLQQALVSMSPQAQPSQTLSDLYHGLIALDQEKAQRKGVEMPEVRVEQLWGVLLMMFRRHGFEPECVGLGVDQEVAKCMAYFYHFHTLGRGFFAGVAQALQGLREKNIKVGLLANAQFYTPMDLSFFLRDSSGDVIADYLDIFDRELIYFSYEYGQAKPSTLLYRRLYDALYEYHILPAQTVMVGNDLVMDIESAQQIGMKTALYCGNEQSTFLHDKNGTVHPDISFSSYEQLPKMVSFFGEQKAEA